jgi:hypothetical protein
VSTAAWLLLAFVLAGCSAGHHAAGLDGGAGAGGTSTAGQDGAAGDDAATDSDGATDVGGATARADAADDMGPTDVAEPSCPPIPMDPVDSGGADASAGFTGPFDCTLVAGTLPTAEWFNAGFENDCLDGSKWEGKFVQYGYITAWQADPAIDTQGGYAWNAQVISPCEKNPTAPDRVLFTAWSFALSEDEAAYVSTTARAIQQFIRNYPSMKRLDLMTIVRCPGDPTTNPGGKMCNANDDYVHSYNNPALQDCYVPPLVDHALDQVAAMFPGLVFVAPKFYSPACRMPLDGLHLGTENNTQVAKDIAQYYRSNP